MVTVLEEMAAETLSLEHVQRRLADWAQRIDGLFSQIAAWTTPDWTAVAPRRTVQMDEEPMREVGLRPIGLPVLDLVKDGRPSVSIVPRGLWIIGANGRLVVSHQDGQAPSHFLVDEAENFEPPEWRIVDLKDRSKRLPLDKTILLSIL